MLDGHHSCEGITLTCGHHRATKTGVSLYSSVRAMVPVLRNRCELETSFGVSRLPRAEREQGVELGRE